MKKSLHIILMVITLVLAVVCGLMIPHIHVNSDMTKYLPDDSPMKKGIEIIASEFGEGQLSNADVKVMFHGLDSLQRKTVSNELALKPEVNGVTTEVSDDGEYTKFDLLVPPSIDQKAFGATIQQQFGDDIIVETSQDGATPPMSALIIAGAIILIILLVTAQSWMEPLLYLFAIGVAVILNIGTNALLPSVSITTNYIVAILQLVLSLDYAIVLSNRYRQEISPDSTPVESINRAMKKAFPAIMSSASTTIVGLMMLAFMRVKIGLDLGVVLAKGVVCSLITTFSLLPALLMLFHNAILRSHKRTFILPTDRLAWFATHHKIPMAVTAVILFVAGFFFSKQTDIYFSTNGESQISKIFPKTNMIVTVYPTAEEMQVIPLADSLLGDSMVKAIISYPTLLKKQSTAEQMLQYIQKMSVDMADYMPPVDLTQLTPEVMRTVYYMRTHEADTLRITFPDLMQFVQTYCMNNPMFDKAINDEARQQMALLDEMMKVGNTAMEEAAVKKEEVAVAPVIEEPVVEKTKKELRQERREQRREEREQKREEREQKREQRHQTNEITTEKEHLIFVNEFMPKLYTSQPNQTTEDLYNLTNLELMDKPMNVRQMAEHIGSTAMQTKLVYSFSDSGKSMTPYTYVHFLTDDLFHRPTLSKFVSAKQKQELILRAQLMDAAKHKRGLTAEELSEILSKIGFDLTPEQVTALAGKPALPIIHKPVLVDNSVEEDSTDHVATPAASLPPVKRHKTKEELQAERFEQLMYGGKAYTAAQMTAHFNYLGQKIDVTTVNLLYCYYGAYYHYNSSLRMSPEQLLNYAADTLLKLDIVASLLDKQSLQMIDSVQSQLGQAIDMLRHPNYSLMITISDYKDESPETYAFVDRLAALTQQTFSAPSFLIGESVMFSELKNGFSREMTFITILTILAIFLIVAITFRSVVVPTILVIVVMTAVYVNVIVSGLVSGQMLYLAYLIVQSILMGATIDYGILYANYYKELRRSLDKYEAAREAYRGAIPTIMTSGLIMVLGPGVMALLVDDVTISAIVGCISVGAAVAITLILVVLPGVLVVADKWVTAKSIRDKEKQ